jgi:hypothetical protein
MATRLDTLLAALLFGVASTVAAATVDQSQPLFEGVADWSGGTSQGFRAGTSGWLAGIRILVGAMNRGCDLTLDVKHVDDTGMPTGAVLSTATLVKSAFTSSATRWYLVEFPNPCTQTAGEDLAFVLSFGPHGPAPSGWLNIGFTTNNLYANGLCYYSGSYGSEHWAYTDGHIDLAFETLVSHALWAEFDAAPVLGAAPLSVEFSATFFQSNALPPDFYWDFNGDGICDTNGTSLATVTNTYVSNGTYSVSLMVSNSAGESCVVDRQDLIEVLAPASHYISLVGSHETPFETVAKAATNIQAALDIAMAGALIHVMPGVYSGTGNANIDFRGKSVQLVSATGPTRTVIAGQPAQSAFCFHSGESVDCVLSGFTIRECGQLVSTVGGRAVTNPASAIVCVSNSNPSVTNCIVVQNRARRGGGFFIQSSSPLITDCMISSNYATLGGGVFIVDASPTLSGCIIEENVSATFDVAGNVQIRDITGGGIFACSNSSIVVTGGTVRANEGGGLYLAGSTGLVQGVLISGNTRGGSSRFVSDGELEVENHRGAGGGITCVSSIVTVASCRLADNAADVGGGIQAASNSLLVILDSAIVSNCAYRERGVVTIYDPNVRQDGRKHLGSGGGLYCVESAANISNCSFVANLSGNGGGIALVSNSWLSVDESSFTSNEAALVTVLRTILISEPGESYVSTYRYYEGEGGGIYVDESSLAVSSSHLTCNAAGAGAGLALVNCASAVVSDCTFEINRAYADVTGGGGVYALNSVVSIARSALSGNLSGYLDVSRHEFSEGTGTVVSVWDFSHGQGGAVYLATQAVVTANQCTFRSNRGGTSGGHLYCGSMSTALLDRCLLDGGGLLNSVTSTTYGAAASLYGADLQLRGCVMHGGAAVLGGGLYAQSNSMIKVFSSTIAGNRANIAGGGVLLTNSSSIYLVNSIAWDNGSPAIEADPSSTAGATNSYIEGGVAGHPSTADPSLRYGCHLAYDSPCLDSAIPSDAPSTDVHGVEAWDHPVASNPPPATIKDIGGCEFIDNDGDRMSDSWEALFFGHMHQGTNTDSDADGLFDSDEYEANTMPDTTDTDGDSHSDLEEWIAGTRGDDPASVFAVQGCSLAEMTNGMVIAWQTVTGRTYTVWSTTGISPPVWSNNASGILGTGFPASYTSSVAMPGRFFRLGVSRPKVATRRTVAPPPRGAARRSRGDAAPRTNSRQRCVPCPGIRPVQSPCRP